jgi:hypothetical protein
MTDEKREGPGLRELVLKDLTSQDDDARRAFDKEFGSEVPAFADAATKALEVWSQFRDPIEDTDERRVAVTAVVFTAINQNISSFKLFMYGYTVASGALFRQVLEGVSLAALCAAKSLTVLDRYLDDKYSPSKAVADLARHAETARVNAAALKTLTQQYKFYHRYAHLTRLTIAAGANFSLGGLPNVGAHFDPGKLAEYRKEIRSRVSFAKVLPNFVKGVARNVATW